MSVARRTDIVVTTIFEPVWLAGYLANLRRYGHDDQVTLRVICDRKTPASVFAAAAQASSDGFRIDCPTLEEQDAYLAKIGAPADFVPWNSDNRRNIGFLRAWHDGAEVLVSIDDDNHCPEQSDFIAAHQCVGRVADTDPGARQATGAAWFNICALLESDVGVAIYPRGFPYAARGVPGASLQSLTAAAGARTIALNAGLWTDDPDVDAITRLALRPRIRAARPGSVVLDSATWSPINTQNTALVREAIAAYYYVRMGFPLQGMKIDRFGDILSGYFAQACAKHLGHTIRLGSPVVRHLRTPHNPLLDLYHELAGIALIEDLLPWLQQLRLTGATYAEAYASLADALAEAAGAFRGFVWDRGGRDFLTTTAAHMRTWLGLLAVSR